MVLAEDNNGRGTRGVIRIVTRAMPGTKGLQLQIGGMRQENCCFSAKDLRGLRGSHRRTTIAVGSYWAVNSRTTTRGTMKFPQAAGMRGFSRKRLQYGSARARKKKEQQ